MRKPRNFHAMNAISRHAGPMKNRKEKRVKKEIDWEQEYFSEDPREDLEEEDWKDLLKKVQKLVDLERLRDEK